MLELGCSTIKATTLQIQDVSNVDIFVILSLETDSIPKDRTLQHLTDKRYNVGSLHRGSLYLPSIVHVVSIVKLQR